MNAAEAEELATKVAEFLNGTCATLTGVLIQFEAEGADDDKEFCAALDDKVFECDTCGWWHELSELASNDDGTDSVELRCQACADDD